MQHGAGTTATDERRKAALYLFPSNLSEAPLSTVLPESNIVLISEIKHFIVENVRTARRFLKRCNHDIDIDTLTFSTLDVNTDPATVDAMLEPLGRGESIGVISEAGCPAVADPGALAVAAAHRKGYEVVPLVGPSSILLSLMASGFNGQRFSFNGYLPIDASARTAALKRLYKESCANDSTQIFIETPYRNNRMVADIIAALPPHARLCVAVNLTDRAQKIISQPLSRWKGEKISIDKIPAIFLLYHP